MKTHTFYRKADVPKAEALDALMKRFPSADILRFVEKKASSSEAKAAGTRPGSKVYEARIRIAEFPPSDDDSSESEDSGSEDSESPEPKSESKPKSKSDEGGESESSDSGDSAAPSFDSPGEGGDELGGEPKEMSHDEKVEHLLEQILDAVKGGGLGGGPEEDLLGGGPDDAGLGLPDIGAPEQGEPLPPPAGGPGGPGGAPLPPPAKPKGVGAPAAFAKVNPKADKVILVREGVNDSVTTSSLKAEAEELFETHRVAKIRRRGTEVINGSKVDLPKAGLAVVTLVKK